MGDVEGFDVAIVCRHGFWLYLKSWHFGAKSPSSIHAGAKTIRGFHGSPGPESETFEPFPGDGINDVDDRRSGWRAGVGSSDDRVCRRRGMGDGTSRLRG